MPKSKILIIDDEQSIADALSLMLQARNYSVCLAVNGHEGFEKAKSERPNLIILGVMTTGIDGYNVCMKLKSDRDTKGIPVVIINTKAERDSNVKYHNIDVSNYIDKLFNLPTLLGKLGKYIRK